MINCAALRVLANDTAMNIDKVTLSISPSFSRSWLVSLAKVDSGESYLLTLLRTKRNHSLGLDGLSDDNKARFCDLREVVIAKSEAEDFIRRCHQISIMAVPCFVMGCDGTSFSLEIRCGFNQVHYSWWSETPKEWKALDEIVGTMEQWRKTYGWD